MAWGELNVEPADLTRVAGEYSGLQTAAASIGPQAVDEVNRIIASHGPIAYRAADHLGAERFEALDFSQSATPPTLGDDDPPAYFPKNVCWIGTADGDTSVCSKDTTEYMYVEDGAWKNRQVDNGFVSGLPPSAGGPRTTLLPEPPAPGSDPFADAGPRDRTVYWPNPDGSMGRAWRQPDGSVISTQDTGPGLQISPILPGDLSMWGQEPI